MFNSANNSQHSLLDDLRSLATHAEELLKAATSLSGEDVQHTREKLEESLQHTRQYLEQRHSRAREKAKQMAAATDQYVHERPWRFALGGVALGMLLGAACTASYSSRRSPG